MTPAIDKAKGRCRSCGADIWWLRHSGSGKLNPINPEPVVGGNIFVHEDSGEWSVRPTRHDFRAHVSHFTTCPDAASHRKERTA